MKRRPADFITLFNANAEVDRLRDLVEGLMEQLKTQISENIKEIADARHQAHLHKVFAEKAEAQLAEAQLALREIAVGKLACDNDGYAIMAVRMIGIAQRALGYNRSKT